MYSTIRGRLGWEKWKVGGQAMSPDLVAKKQNKGAALQLKGPWKVYGTKNDLIRNVLGGFSPTLRAPCSLLPLSYG